MLIELDSVLVAFGAKTALDRISVTLDQKRIGVIGLNGSGKSTFARLLNGLVTPTSGMVRVGGIDVAKETKAARQQTGFIFSNPDLQIVMPTVFEDVAFSLRSAKLNKVEVRAKVLATLKRFGLQDLADEPAHSLSSGQKQLLAIAAIVINQPALIIADEPTALLDLANTRAVADILLEELEQQVVLVTHDMSLAERCDVVIRFNNGEIYEIGDPKTVVAKFLRVYA